MIKPKLKIMRTNPKRDADINLPEYKTKGAAGMDIEAAIDDVDAWGHYTDMLIPPFQSELIRTGFAIAIQQDFCGRIEPRSSAVKRGLFVHGIIDSDYRGEVFIQVINLSGQNVFIKRGERIAQVLITPAPQFDIELVTELDETERGNGGFGSTGK